MHLEEPVNKKQNVLEKNYIDISNPNFPPSPTSPKLPILLSPNLVSFKKKHNQLNIIYAVCTYVGVGSFNTAWAMYQQPHSRRKKASLPHNIHQ